MRYSRVRYGMLINAREFCSHVWGKEIRVPEFIRVSRAGLGNFRIMFGVKRFELRKPCDVADVAALWPPFALYYFVSRIVTLFL